MIATTLCIIGLIIQPLLAALALPAGCCCCAPIASVPTAGVSEVEQNVSAAESECCCCTIVKTVAKTANSDCSSCCCSEPHDSADAVGCCCDSNGCDCPCGCCEAPTNLPDATVESRRELTEPVDCFTIAPATDSAPLETLSNRVNNHVVALPKGSAGTYQQRLCVWLN